AEAVPRNGIARGALLAAGEAAALAAGEALAAGAGEADFLEAANASDGAQTTSAATHAAVMMCDFRFMVRLLVGWLF
ncbi:MAG: hypothetical protein ACXV97_05070, partial [Chthoniobacterales bacterium]